MSRGRTYDLKVGYTCNNKCIHCVIEPNVDSLKKLNTKIDSSFSEIVNEIDTPEFLKSNHIVLTGGEITIRREFMRILKLITSKFPEKKISIQTNGRNLKPFVQEIYELNKNVQYIVAVHSMDEEIHNQIVGNAFDLKSPFVETMESLKEIIRVYGSFKEAGRIEIVLSNKNLFNLLPTITKLHEMSVDRIGISYPHLDGFYYMDGIDRVREIGFSYEELKNVLPFVYNYLKQNPDLHCDFEEVPMCIWRNKDGELLPKLDNIGTMDIANDVTVKFPGQEKNNDFKKVWDNMHKKPDKCKECVISCNCPGIWFESELAFGDEGIIPIAESELSLLNGGGN